MIEAEKVKAENAERQKMLALAYKRFWEHGTPLPDDCKLIRKDLEQFCNKDNSCVNEQIPNTLQTFYNLGKRRVLLRIEGFIRKEEENE